MKTHYEIKSACDSVFFNDDYFKGVLHYKCPCQIHTFLSKFKHKAYFIIHICDGYTISVMKRRDNTVMIFKPFSSQIFDQIIPKIKRILQNGPYVIETDPTYTALDTDDDITYGAQVCIKFLWYASSCSMDYSTFINVHRLIFPKDFTDKERIKVTEFLSYLITSKCQEQLALKLTIS